MRKIVKEELYHLKDETYKQFSLKLLPGAKEDSMIGVRLPFLRKKAAEIIKTPYWKEYIKEKDDLLFEEKMLQGMIIGKAVLDPAEKIKLIDGFLPKIDNWSICDSFCSSLKFAREEKNQTKVWNYLVPLFLSSKEYYVRFALVMSLQYFLNDKFIDNVLESYESVKHDGYYAKMALAWGISMAYIKNSEKTLSFLEENDRKNNLDKFTFNKAIQKILESYQVDSKEKMLLKKIKKG